jgi:hypothetical protein
MLDALFYDRVRSPTKRIQRAAAVTGAGDLS